MEDAVRPSEEQTRTMFEKSFRVWSQLRAPASGIPSLPAYCLGGLETAFPEHPAFPRQLLLGYWGGNLTAEGTSTWDTVGDASASCLLPSFHRPFQIPISTHKPTYIGLSKDPRLGLPQFFKKDDNHIMILPLRYTDSHAPECDCIDRFSSLPSSLTFVNLGTVDRDATRWWAAVLAPEEGWLSTIDGPRNELRSPWSVRLPKKPIFALPPFSVSSPPSYTMAMQYLEDYTAFHNVEDQSRAALSAALLLPLANLEGGRIPLPVPRIPYKSGARSVAQLGHERRSVLPTPQLDKLITLSWNRDGLSALLSSVFFDATVPCNLASAWLQGVFSVLDSVESSHEALAHILVRKNPQLGFFWLGALLTGLHRSIIQRARLGSCDIELHSAAWTRTLQSFIQLPVSQIETAGAILRSDECRLLYLSSEEYQSRVPMSPWEPFGETALKDTEIEVRLHAHCGEHGLVYNAWSWNCDEQAQNGSLPSKGELLRAFPFMSALVPPHNRPSEADGSNGIKDVVVFFDDFDPEDEDASCHATLSAFMWLRRDGFPAAEQDIRHHEWLCEVLDQEDEEAYESWSDWGDSNEAKRKLKSDVPVPKLTK
ncbi:hypothetical protein AK830_g9244 [Neonectria ditissima]|uniref:Uncharacterized protein n=1 Tax=Neonectria ditissima TaxID=78410 RepID=A0A0P7B9H3_9HYPO|nr:hypothetical protein AK830_g9244 [Neonectria ditissima]